MNQKFSKIHKEILKKVQIINFYTIKLMKMVFKK